MPDLKHRNYLIELGSLPELKKTIAAMSGTADDIEWLAGFILTEKSGKARKSLFREATAAKNKFQDALDAKAKAPAEAVASEVTTDQPQDPEWDSIRQSLIAVRNAGRTYLYLQAWFGWVLSEKKKEHQKTEGAGRGGDRKGINRPIGRLTWAEKVEAELGVPVRTADRFITLHEGMKAKLKKVVAKEKKSGKESLALSMFETASPLALAPEKLEELQTIASSLCDGESQASLMQELGIVPKPTAIKQAANKKPAEPEPDEQIAFAFWKARASSICDARAQGEKALYLLPLESTDPEKPGLKFLQTETAALLKAIEDAVATHTKAAKKIA